MKKILNLLAVCAIAVLSVSCAKSRTEQMKLAENVDVSCTPEVLTLVGNKVDAEVTVTFPAKYFYTKALLKVTPVLVYEGGEVAAQTFTYQGEKVKDNYPVVSYSGGSVTMKVSYEYVPGMEKCYLELRSVASYKTTEVEVPAMKAADGLNVTQMLAGKRGVYSFKADAYQDVIRESTEGQVMYDYNSAVVKNSELRSASVQSLQESLAEIAENPRYTVAGTRIVSYASPEGGQEYNAKLSDRRAASAEKVWDKVTNGMEANEIQVQSVGQDWEGFQEAVSNSDLEDKELILRVLSMYSDPAVRESEIRNMSQVYQEIAKDIFPGLRRARFIADLDFQNYSNEELTELVNSSVELFDEEALLRVATLVDDSRKVEIYELAVNKFDSDRARFNLAVLALNEKDADKAAGYLNAVKEPDADVTNAKGVCELQKGNLDAAESLFSQAGTPDAKVNLGIVQILKGDYAAAVNTLSGTGGYYEALANVLVGNYDKASSLLTCDCPKSNYLRAVIAARQGKADDVAAYLEKVAAASPELMAKAEKDVEFANYR